jgi:hypothetical protein
MNLLRPHCQYFQITAYTLWFVRGCYEDRGNMDNCLLGTIFSKGQFSKNLCLSIKVGLFFQCAKIVRV